MDELKSREICPKCGCVSDILEHDLKSGFFNDKKEKTYKVLYYECKCGSKNVLQIDDASMQKDYEELKRLVIRAYVRLHNEKNVPEKWAVKKDKISNRLRKKRRKMFEKMHGEKLESVEGNIELIVDKKVKSVV